MAKKKTGKKKEPTREERGKQLDAQVWEEEGGMEDDGEIRMNWMLEYNRVGSPGRNKQQLDATTMEDAKFEAANYLDIDSADIGDG